MLPSFAGDAPLGGHAWVPVDDTKVWAFGVSWHPRRPLSAQELAWFREGTPTGIHSTMIPGTATAKRNKGNRYADPDAPGTQPWLRITHFQDQDTAITESIGSAFDRTQERLGSTDIVIANLRRRLAEAARALSAGTEPQKTNAKGYRYRGISSPPAARRYAVVVGCRRRMDGDAARNLQARHMRRAISRGQSMRIRARIVVAAFALLSLGAPAQALDKVTVGTAVWPIWAFLPPRDRHRERHLA